MKFYDRYINGEDGRGIYNEICSLGQDAFSERYFVDVENVLTETFMRVAANLNIIYAELKNINYVFYSGSQNFEKPLLGPLKDTEQLLVKLDESVKDFGHVPYSLKLFYKIVGSCNFAWDYESEPRLLWRCADPIQIYSLDDLVSEVSGEDWRAYMDEMMEDDETPFLDLAADYLHKDNISGGPAYAIQMTEEPSVDSLFLNESNETTFIDYLRICMENCGFSKITDPQHKNDYQGFFEKVKPQLKRI